MVVEVLESGDDRLVDVRTEYLAGTPVTTWLEVVVRDRDRVVLTAVQDGDPAQAPTLADRLSELPAPD